MHSFGILFSNVPFLGFVHKVSTVHMYILRCYDHFVKFYIVTYISLCFDYMVNVILYCTYKYDFGQKWLTGFVM